jgi:hypothetical protein
MALRAFASCELLTLAVNDRRVRRTRVADANGETRRHARARLPNNLVTGEEAKTFRRSVQPAILGAPDEKVVNWIGPLFHSSCGRSRNSSC